MVRHELGLRLRGLRKLCSEDFRNLQMIFLTFCAEEGTIRGLLNHRVFENIVRSRWQAALKKQLGLNQLRQAVVQVGRSHPRCCGNQRIGELPTKDGSALGDGLA